MRYLYSLAQYVADPARGERINIGAIVGSDDAGDWALRSAPPSTRLRAFDDTGHLSQAMAVLQDVGRVLDVYNDRQLKLDRDSPSEDWLNRLASDYNNVVRFTGPRPIVADSAEEVLDLLFEQVIAEPDTRLPRQFARKQTVLASVRRVYEQRLAHSPAHLAPNALMVIGPYQHRCDLAVYGKVVVQVVQTWSFEVTDLQGLEQEVLSWGWRMSHLRGEGGIVKVGEQEIEVAKDADLVVGYAPSPTPNPISIQDVFQELRVQAVPFKEEHRLQGMANQALKKLEIY